MVKADESGCKPCEGGRLKATSCSGRRPRLESHWNASDMREEHRSGFFRSFCWAITCTRAIPEIAHHSIFRTGLKVRVEADFFWNPMHLGKFSNSAIVYPLEDQFHVQVVQMSS